MVMRDDKTLSQPKRFRNRWTLTFSMRLSTSAEMALLKKQINFKTGPRFSLKHKLNAQIWHHSFRIKS